MTSSLTNTIRFTDSLAKTNGFRVTGYGDDSLHFGGAERKRGLAVAVELPGLWHGFLGVIGHSACNVSGHP
jgi:hypothetical protein